MLIKIDKKGVIVSVYRGAEPIEESGYMCVTDMDGLDTSIRFFDEQGIPLYMWDGVQVINRTAAEIASDRTALPKPEPTNRERIAALEMDGLKAKQCIAELGNLIGQIIRGGMVK